MLGLVDTSHSMQDVYSDTYRLAVNGNTLSIECLEDKFTESTVIWWSTGCIESLSGSPFNAQRMRQILDGQDRLSWLSTGTRRTSRGWTNCMHEVTGLMYSPTGQIQLNGYESQHTVSA